MRRQRPGTGWGEQTHLQPQPGVSSIGDKEIFKESGSLGKRECTETPFTCQEKEGSAIEVITVKYFQKIMT